MPDLFEPHPNALPCPKCSRVTHIPSDREPVVDERSVIPESAVFFCQYCGSKIALRQRSTKLAALQGQILEKYTLMALDDGYLLTEDIFVSYSHKDEQWTKLFIASLRKAGHNVWFDNGLNAGADWLKTIEAELEARPIFVIVLSPDAWESPWVQKEAALAQASNRTIIPVMLKPTGLTGFLRTVQVVSAASRDAYSVAEAVSDILIQLRETDRSKR